MGLREPVQKHLQSSLPFLERQGRADRYTEHLNSLTGDLQGTHAQPEEVTSFNSWATRYLSYDHSKRPELPDRSTPRDALLYAQGYLDQRRELQPTRSTLPEADELWQFCWDYHQGRHLTFNIAGNDPRLSAGIQLGIMDRRALAATSAAHAGRTRQRPPSQQRT